MTWPATATGAEQVVKAVSRSAPQIERRAETAFEEAAPALIGQFVEQGICAKSTLYSHVSVILDVASADAEGQDVQIAVQIDIVYSRVVDAGDEDGGWSAFKGEIKLGKRVAEVN